MKILDRSKLKISKPKLILSAVLALIIIVNVVIISFYLGEKVWNSSWIDKYVTKEQLNVFLQYLNQKLQRFNTFITENMLK